MENIYKKNHFNLFEIVEKFSRIFPLEKYKENINYFFLVNDPLDPQPIPGSTSYDSRDLTKKYVPLCLLPLELEEEHQKARQTLEELLGKEVLPIPSIVHGEIAEKGRYCGDDRQIIIASKHVQSALSGKPEQFRATAIHEYAHDVFRREYLSTVFSLIPRNVPGDREKELTAINEAFAFWAEQACMGEEYELTELKALYYEDVADARTLKWMYTQLKQKTEEKDAKYVARNLPAIVAQALLSVDDVTLKGIDGFKLYQTLLEILKPYSNQNIQPFPSVP